MAFGLGKVQNLSSSLNSLGSAFRNAGSTAKTASNQFRSANQDIGAIQNHVKTAQMSLKYLRSAWSFLVAGAARDSKSLRNDIDSLTKAYKRLQENMGSGLAPAFELVAEVLTGVFKFLNKNKTVATALGIVMGGLLSVLSVVVAEYAALTAYLVLTEALLANTTTGIYLNAAAQHVWAKATGAVTKAKKFLVSTLTKENAVKAASAVKSAAVSAAEFVWAKATGAVTKAKKFLVNTLTKEN
ncbi:hypothetical protein, partial [Halorussus sp. MSC15.2]|uniref:hypothetical protein n=1 Tax=Halorussus sp. MSC15.2 TaxID=2283638 RepID=UPI0013D1711B